ncbi:hypothetical protein UPYG_G00332690 [Umbra pygmaea]|uniref:Ion transport domain-containing protein n=1 Tax=Umbra pygmaea TaxID=75934 RepID=A0ABD0VVN4_UMBPY
MHYMKRLRILQRASENARGKWTLLDGDELLELNNIKDITQPEDGSNEKDDVIQVFVGELLEHIMFKILMLIVIFSNFIIISLKSYKKLERKYIVVFSMGEVVVLTVFVWEILVKWYYGFKIFWKSPWNVLDFLLTLPIIIGTLILPEGGDNLQHIISVLLVFRGIRTFALIPGVALMCTVMKQSMPDMINTFILLSCFMLVFGVFGVNLFSAVVPSAFGDLASAVFSLFVCVTQDGWNHIYFEFLDVDYILLFAASLYFLLFVGFGAFFFTNVLIAVVATNMEAVMTDIEDNTDETLQAALTPEGMEDLKNQSITHMEEVVKKTTMTQFQKPWKGSCLENLSMDTFEELVLARAAMQKVMAAYRKRRQELESIVEELHSISFNIEQDQEVLKRTQMSSALHEDILKNEITTGLSGDMLSTLIALEKAHFIDTSTASPKLIQRGMCHTALRLSTDNQNVSTPSTSTDSDGSDSDSTSAHHNTD